MVDSMFKVYSKHSVHGYIDAHLCLHTECIATCSNHPTKSKNLHNGLVHFMVQTTRCLGICGLHTEHLNIEVTDKTSQMPRPKDYETCIMLNSTEHDISTLHKSLGA